MTASKGMPMALERTIMLISWMTFCVLSSLNGSRSLTVLFHLFAPYQHEVEYKDQYEDVDGKTADTSHDGLPDAGKN